MMSYLMMAHTGLGNAQLGSALIHASMGTFFALSGWNKLFNKGRHQVLVSTLKRDHVPALRFMQWWVPSWELVGGAGLMLGVLPAFCAAVLAIICLVATCAEGRQRVASYQPINAADRLDDWLYLPEMVYLLILAAITLGV